MKGIFKIVSILIVLACMGQMLIGCQNTTKEIVYESEIVEISLGTGDENVSITDNLWPTPTKQAGEMGNRSCDFMGEHFSGEYRLSYPYFYTPIVGDLYRTSEGYEFVLDRKTGELLLISFMGKDYFETEPLFEDVENPEETAVEIATNLAKNYIRLSDYEQTVTLHVYSEGTDEEIRTYRIEFTKYIQGYKTSDYMTVLVTSKGHLISMNMSYIGGLDDVTVEIDKQKVSDSALAKVRGIYENMSYTVENMYIESSTLGRSQQGELGVYSQVITELKNIDGTNYNYTTCLGVFTFLRYE